MRLLATIGGGRYMEGPLVGVPVAYLLAYKLAHQLDPLRGAQLARQGNFHLPVGRAVLALVGVGGLARPSERLVGTREVVEEDGLGLRLPRGEELVGEAHQHLLARGRRHADQAYCRGAEFAADHDTWKLNVAHTFFMQDE